jgi:hypothetical protein
VTASPFDQLAPMPALQAVLDATTTLRAGALVFDNDDEHPAILAEELATMDVLSGGRVEILLERRERYGFSYVIVGAGEIDAFAPVVAELAGR